MKQLLQNLSSGEIIIKEVPVPNSKKDYILIQSSSSLISSGTERMLLDFGKANLIQKAISQPTKVKEVIDKVKTDGIDQTIEAVKSKLDAPMPMGYCNVGKVIDGGGTSFEKDQRVISNGFHAEVVRVPKNLVCSVPDSVDDETAAFTVLGAISLQGIRLINPSLGENIVVIGLGILGLLSIQILKANGCNVLGVDVDKEKCRIAEELGIKAINPKEEDLISISNTFSKNRGVDGVLITANSKDHQIIRDSAAISRKRGRIVLVGVVGLEINREDFYEKELTFQVSCSYGPGRYDSDYEEKGKDYPFPFVRWTEQRNFEAVLDLMASGSINVKPLISYRLDFEEAHQGYRKLDDRSTLGILFNYPNNKLDLEKESFVELRKQHPSKQDINISFIGSGNYASKVLMPSFKKEKVDFETIVNDGGISSAQQGDKFNFKFSSTDINKALNEDTDIVVIATRHNSHSDLVVQALEKGKHVFVEKPLSLTKEGIKDIRKVHENSDALLMVGYNRRFSPLVNKMKSLIETKSEPKLFIMTMNAGYISSDHWTQDLDIGGGRIIGEACHYIDLMSFLASSDIRSYKVSKMGEKGSSVQKNDNAIITIKFENGSIGTIHYFSNGSKSFPKERIEVSCGGSILQLDNFRSLYGYGWKGFNKMKLWRQDKGQKECIRVFLDSIRTGGLSPISSEELFQITELTIDIAQELES